MTDPKNILIVRIPAGDIPALEAMRDYIHASLQLGVVAVPKDTTLEVMELPKDILDAVLLNTTRVTITVPDTPAIVPLGLATPMHNTILDTVPPPLKAWRQIDQDLSSLESREEATT